jgi:wyosine [tRNA(Phe)-imidazoG37] synthetase (radical SAM superfamily)
MPSNRRRGRRRIAAIATAVAAVTLTAGLLTGCEDLDSSLDCLGNADSISDSVKAIHEAGWDAVKDPSKTDDSIDTIDKNLDKINKETDDNKVDKAVDDLDKAIDDYNKSILNGDTTPDSSKIDAAADRLKDVCTS